MVIIAQHCQLSVPRRLRPTAPGFALSFLGYIRLWAATREIEDLTVNMGGNGWLLETQRQEFGNTVAHLSHAAHHNAALQKQTAVPSVFALDTTAWLQRVSPFVRFQGPVQARQQTGHSGSRNL